MDKAFKNYDSWKTHNSADSAEIPEEGFCLRCKNPLEWENDISVNEDTGLPELGGGSFNDCNCDPGQA